MRKIFSYSVLAALLLSAAPFQNVRAQAAEEADSPASEKSFDPTETIMHHIQDAHGFHVFGEGHDAVTVPLPVILWTDQGLVSFSSSAFHHDVEGKHVVERNGMRFVNYHEDIYQLEPGAEELQMAEDHSALNAALPLDFSITKNVFTLLLAAVLLVLMFTAVAANYRKSLVPRGFASFMEPLILFVRDEIAAPNIGPKYPRYMPYLLTLFFFIWLINLMGLVPFFPFSANLSGNISFTLTLAVIALLVVNFSGNKHYWKHIFAPKPWWLWPILFVIEFLSNVVIKFFALMIRLFANITAGHIIILSLVSLIFIFRSVYMSAVSVPFALFISVLELLVAALQAFIFTLLTALFIGQAVAEESH